MGGFPCSLDKCLATALTQCKITCLTKVIAVHVGDFQFVTPISATCMHLKLNIIFILRKIVFIDNQKIEYNLKIKA